MVEFWGLVYDAKDAERAGGVVDTKDKAFDLVGVIEQAKELAGIDRSFELYRWDGEQWIREGGAPS
jgi:hypothetical protein